MKRALITGITGQDGSYLAEFLLKKGYEVHGVKRRSSSFNTARIDHIYEDKNLANAKLQLHYGDLSDTSNLTRLLSEIRPDEVYNLGAQSHVSVSFEAPEYTADVDALGTLRLLEAIRFLGMEKTARFYQASTSELFGLVQETPQKETTPFHPRSPYAVAKMYAYWIAVNYREAYGLYACNGILFNHESPRRGETFVTRKVTRGLSNPRLFTKQPPQRWFADPYPSIQQKTCMLIAFLRMSDSRMGDYDYKLRKYSAFSKRKAHLSCRGTLYYAS